MNKNTYYDVSILFYEKQNFLQRLFKRKIQSGETIVRVASPNIFSAKVDAYKNLMRTPIHLTIRDSKNKKRDLKSAEEHMHELLNSKVNWVKTLQCEKGNFVWKIAEECA